ncbi:MAG TPA: YdcF family protein [Thermohalobaculum sp.]|nr:YdcF family protein [Thermohalobaculum sp.]
MGVIGRWLRRVLQLGVAVLGLTVAAVMYFSSSNMAQYGNGAGLDAPVAAIIVLGGGIDGDGVLGYSSRRRVRAAVALLQAGKAEALILTGFSRDPRRWPSLAELMRDHAVSLGADPDRLILEERSRTTFENLRFGFALADSRGLQDIALLSDAFHIERARHLAAYLGRPDVRLVAAYGLSIDTPGNRVWGILREALAWWYNLYKVAGWEALGALGYSVDERGAMIR